MKLFNRRRRRADTQRGSVTDRRWEYLASQSDLVSELAEEVTASARRGQPDPVHGRSAPEVFTRSNATFAQLAQSARKDAAVDCADDVAFLVDHAAEYAALRDTGSRMAGSSGGADGVEKERVARLRTEIGRRLGHLAAREEQHRADLADLKHAAEATTAFLQASWESAHPHPDHLGHFAVPAFAMPADAADIGQHAVRAALGIAADLTNNTATFAKE